MQLWQTRWFLAGLALAASLGTQTARAEITFTCSSPYAEIPLGEFVHEFATLINSDVSGGEEVHLEVNPVLPAGWAWQVCQTSTGICYFNESVDLMIQRSQKPDTLRFDFFPNPSVAGTGYLQVALQKSDDPLDVSYCTATLFNGVENPEVQWGIDCTENTHFGSLSEDVWEFHCPIVLENPLEDTITIRPSAQMPAGWAWQFCQTSTGICYFSETTIPLTIGVDDTLRVDFFMSGPAGRGSIDLELFSESNPSIWRRCYYRVFRGSFPSDVPEVMQGVSTAASFAQPNPFTESTALRFELQSGGQADLAIYSAEGRAVRTMRDLATAAGSFDVSWDGRSDEGAAVPAGVYFYRLKTASEEAKGIMVRAR
jgi:hypothetical protein